MHCIDDSADGIVLKAAGTQSILLLALLMTDSSSS